MIPTRLLGAGLVLGLLASQAVSAEPARVEGYTFVKALDGIEEYRLDANGLTVLVLPNHAAPVVTVQVTYRVGARNEVPGTTGNTHLLEHLMFKGSREFNREKGNGVDTYLETVGARFNATTAYDRTNYFATIGRDDLEGYIAIDADRMRGLLLRKQDLDSEMTVVRNEYEQGENRPESVLDKLVRATAYQAHPYHHPIIGWRSDIENSTVEKLRAFYDTFYWPNNATVTIVGDVEPAQVLTLVKKYYGGIPRSPAPIPEMTTLEPPQEGPRRIALHRAGASGFVTIAWKAPSALDEDAPALNVLALVLQEGRSSRLSRALVDASLASSATAYMGMDRDPGLFTVAAQLVPGVMHEKAEQIILAEIERIKRDGVTADEIRRVLGRNRASEAYRRDGSAGAVSWLNEYIAMGDWTLYVTGLGQMEKVTPADVQRVAAKYLVSNQSTTGWFVPEKKQ